ncbi:MAG TPA: heme o synthase [Vicinamibacterales bacterium]|jgi:protoheme IX farnesyltransferase|nr:heme o synthase [Vicinamibacterales bacterium]
MKDVASAPLAIERRSGSPVADYIQLAKPRLNLLVVATSAAGYYLGGPPSTDLALMAQAVTGTALVAGGAAVLNQLYERDTDALMRRTRLRPLPDGRVSPADARVFGLVLTIAGLLLLATRANLLAAGLAFATVFVYLIIYTPMKLLTPASTLVGAVPGALPAVIGWAASHGSVGVGGMTLFAIVFLWQIPHFMAIAWLYRDDYRKAGFPMVSVIEPSGVRAGSQAALFAAMLVPITLAASTSAVSFTVILALGLAQFALALRFLMTRSDASARALFVGSITYLPLLWTVMILGKQ